MSAFNLRARWAKYKWIAQCDEVLRYTVAPHNGPLAAIRDLAAQLSAGRPHHLDRITPCWYRLIIHETEKQTH
jgi:hypothetical protein